MSKDNVGWLKRALGWLRDFISQAAAYYSLVVGSALCSVAWLAYALHVSCKDDASRGGAVTIILSFFILFLRRSYGERVFHSVLRAKPAIQKKLDDVRRLAESSEADKTSISISFTNEESSWLLLGLIGWLNTEADSQTKQNWALVATSVLGTIVWGFGDVFYHWMGGR